MSVRARRRLSARVVLWVALVLCATVAVAGWRLKGTGFLSHLTHGIHTFLHGQPAPVVGPRPPVSGPPDPSIRFEKVPLPVTSGTAYTAVTMGPGHLLYAGSDDGRIFRFAIRGDGTLEAPQIIDSLQTASGGKRLLIGLCFDPGATVDNPVVWVTHSYHSVRGAPDWEGKVTRMSGKDLDVVQDVVINLPRSYNDHATNQPSFGPDGALYIPQGSNTSYGAPDEYWGNRDEHLLSGSILRLDVKKVIPGKPLDARTADGGGSYDPYTSGAPLTIYAGGIRNAYDLVWTSSGRLYAPVNGAAVGGNAPAGDGAPALTNIPDAEDDWLDLITPGKYYGHPNPQQRHYVIDGGNPTGQRRPGEIPQYPTGTQPDSDFDPPVLDFGCHSSTDGIIEYRGNAFGGKLDHALLVCRYNLNSDILCVQLDAEGKVSRVQSEIQGFTKFANPLDLAEDLRTGNLYVAEYGGKQLTLLRPTTAELSEPVKNRNDAAPPAPRPIND